VLAIRNAPLLADGRLVPPPDAWCDTAVLLPEEWQAQQCLTDALSTAPVAAEGGRLAVAGLLRELPVCLLLTADARG